MQHIRTYATKEEVECALQTYSRAGFKEYRKGNPEAVTSNLTTEVIWANFLLKI